LNITTNFKINLF